MQQAKLGPLFTRPDAHPVVLSDAMLKLFGPEYLAWEPEACWDEIRYETGSTVSYANVQRIQAMRAVYLSAEMLTEWHVFEKVTAGLHGEAPLLRMVQRQTPDRTGPVLHIIGLIRDNDTVGDEVWKYCAAGLRDTGFVYGPGPLQPANKYMTDTAGMGDTVRAAFLRGTQPDALKDETLSEQLAKTIALSDYIGFTHKWMLDQKEEYGL